MYALFPFPTLACASIFLSTRLHGVALPDGWHDLFDAELEDVRSVAGYVMRLYRDRGEEGKSRCVELVLGGKKTVRKFLEGE